MAVGIIAEYNPFHNGHLYHLNKVKEMYPNDIVVLVMSGNFTERGDISIINKWDKTKIALEYGIDLIIELPFCYTLESADTFSYGAVRLLNNLLVDKLVFGSELNDIDKLSKLAAIQLNSNYDILVNECIKNGINYPTALSTALEKLGGINVNTPNDILGISYIREIKKQKANITPISIKRTNDYHSKELDNIIASATSIRKALKSNIIINEFVPTKVLKYIPNYIKDINNYYDVLKYKIISDDNLTIYQNVDVSLNTRIKKFILVSTDLNDLILKIKNKRYTYSKVKRALVSIICNYTKEEAKQNKEYNYIRVLGFNNKGRTYLNNIKKEIDIPIITNYKEKYHEFLKLESKVTNIYNLKEKDKNLIYLEHASKPIIR